MSTGKIVVGIEGRKAIHGSIDRLIYEKDIGGFSHSSYQPHPRPVLPFYHLRT